MVDLATSGQVTDCGDRWKAVAGGEGIGRDSSGSSSRETPQCFQNRKSLRNYHQTKTHIPFGVILL